MRVSRSLSPFTWLAESRLQANALVYTSEVLGPIKAVSTGLADEVPRIDLSEEYLKRAGAYARVRAAEAASRLVGIWREALK